MHGSSELGIEKDLNPFSAYSLHNSFYAWIEFRALDTKEDACFIKESELEGAKKPFNCSYPVYWDQGFATVLLS